MDGTALGMIQNPPQLRPGKIGIDHEAGLGPECVHQPLFLQRVTVFGGAAALPHDGVVDRLTGDLVPDTGCWWCRNPAPLHTSP